ncbi:hypothetical protein CSA56_13705 [candidate division KSB3 bacterium]|uniref:EF-hand domain-containing protein n=1 Tax=candidate division KSB3 bacterium TaxID=2044937 RepID=A0A2G6KC86_9BACT|nr:MAG: hypothetical protein CSA56_13705 [candidate division KSB3 bacterium]
MNIQELAQPSSSKWFHFEHYGKSYHLIIETADALEQIIELDEAHWVATTAPISTINADPEFLALLDSDCDGQIRSEEVKQAIIWTLELLKDRTGIRPGNKTLEPSVVSTDVKEGRWITATIKKMYRRETISDNSPITLDTVRQLEKAEEEGGIDTAGVVLPAAAEDKQRREFLEDILATVGGSPHPSGAQGVTNDHLDQFLKEIHEYAAWKAQTELSDEQFVSPIMPFGGKTPELYRLFSGVREKLEQFFILCDAIQVSPILTEQLRQKKASLLNDLDLADSEAITEFLVETPIAWPTTESVLNFEETVNPYYADELKLFRENVLPLVLDEIPVTLSSIQWKLVKECFLAYQQWLESKPQVCVDCVSDERIRRYLSDETLIKGVRRLIQESYKTAFVLDNLRLVEKLILFQANLIPFVNSFVSFPHLYDPNSRALFEMGTLIMDGRHFTLSVKVPNRERHVTFSTASNMFVLYVEICEKEGVPLYEIAVPVTSGVRGNLLVNKRGIFQDSYGRNLHAKVVQIVENPISFLEAFSAPFTRLGRAITTKLDEISSKAEQNLQAFNTETMTNVSTELKKIEGETIAAAQRARQSTGGLLAGGSIAIAALSSSFAFITKTFSGLSWGVIVGGVLIGIAAVMLPTSVVAYVKLSKRDLSCILEGAGWGLNGRMRLTHKQAVTFTLTPPYPPNSKGILLRRCRWFWRLVPLGLLVLWLIYTYWPR